MTKPFFARLTGYLDSIGKVLAGQAAVASVFPNAPDVGSARERVYAEVLRQHVPTSCNVFLGGFLFGADGSESRQLDIIVTTDKVLQFNFHNSDGSGKSFASVDGCIGAVSVKSHLGSAELRDALDNLASIPEQQAIEGRQNPYYKFEGYDDWPYKIVYATSGVASTTALAAIDAFYAERPEIPETRKPHIIHVAGSYVICRARVSFRRNEGVQPRGSFGVVSHKADIQALMLAFKNLQQNAQNASQIIFTYGHILENIATE